MEAVRMNFAADGHRGGGAHEGQVWPGTHGVQHVHGLRVDARDHEAACAGHQVDSARLAGLRPAAAHGLVVDPAGAEQGPPGVAHTLSGVNPVNCTKRRGLPVSLRSTAEMRQGPGETT